MDIKHNRFLILQGEVESISMMKPIGEDLMNLEILKNVCYMAQIDFDPFKYDELYEQVKQIVEQNKETEMYQEFQKIKQIDDTDIQPDSGLLEFIESIVGTQDEIPVIAKQAALVEFINSKMNDTRNQLQQAVQYKNNLDDAKNEAVTDIKAYAKKEQKAMESQMYQASNGRFTCQLLNKENSLITEQLSQLEAKDTTQLELQVKDLEQQIQQVNQQEKEQQAQKDKIEIERKNLQIQNAVNQQNMDDNKSKQSKLENMNKKSQEKIVKLEKEKEKAPIQQKQIQKEIENIQNTIKQLEQNLKQMQVNNKQNQQQLEMREQIGRYEAELDKISQQRIQIQQECSLSQKEQNEMLNVLLQQLRVLYVNLYNIVEQSQKKDKQQVQLYAQKEDIEQKLNQLDKQGTNQQNEQISQEIQNIQQQIQEYDIKISEINSNNQDNSKYNKLYQEIMNAAQHGILQGVYGRLGSLGQIKQEYNTAAIAAFGNQLDVIVCENIESIQQCLEFLRQNKLGNATFLDLQQVSDRYQQYVKNINEKFINDYNGALFLYLVKTENKFLPAFWHVMQETVITNNDDNALILNRYNNRQKLRVVTINGDVFEKSGALTGGNIEELLRNARGFTNQQEINEQQTATKLQQQLQKLNKQFNQLQSQQLSITQRLQQIDNLERKYDQINDQLDQYEQNKQQEIIQTQEYINQIKSIQNNIVIKQLNITVNQSLMQELNNLKEQIAQQKLNYQDSIPQIIELFKYYKENQLISVKQYDQYISKFEKTETVANVFLDENSLLFNLLVLDEQSYQQLNIQKVQSLIEQVQNLQDKEEQLKIQIEQLQQKIDQNPEQQLKKQISNQRQEQHKKEKELNNLQIFIQRFDTQIQTIQQEIQENNNKQIEIAQQIEQLQQQIQQQQQQIDQMLQNEEQIQNTINTLQLTQEKLSIERNEKQKEIEQTNSQINKLKQQQISNQKQIELSIQKIGDAEQQIKVLYQDLEDFNDKLKLVEDQIDSIKPLFNDHEMQEELQNYDDYVLANFSKKEIEFIREGDPITLFPNQYQIIKDYNNRINKILGLQEHYQLISQHYDQQNVILGQIKQNRQIKFNTALTTINQHLRQIYRTFSLGGDAVLEPVDPFDVFQGITLQVLPPKKSWRPVQNLSGGEKTLSSLSLIFALHFYKQNFLYVVDEIDAALDWRNVQLVAGFMKQLTGCQLIIVSLRNGCFEQADEIVGVWKKNGESQVVQAIM